MCASSAAMAIAFDAGGTERQDNFWVGDLTEDEAKELLNLHGHKDKTDEFLEACPLAALFALFCRETHPALSGQPLAFFQAATERWIWCAPVSATRRLERRPFRPRRRRWRRRPTKMWRLF